MFQLDLWTGLRRGELLALSWDNIDLDNRYLKVCQTLVHTSCGDRIVQTTKSRRDRLIPLHSNAIAILHQIRSQDVSDGFLFVSPITHTVISLRRYNRLYRMFYEQQKQSTLIYSISPRISLDIAMQRISFSAVQISKPSEHCSDTLI